ncbi:hypothetical protein BGZ46_007493 [Entomortierella lignicola]|nr:hypothetical protein BGZ46_007493 [Entomortierella lignicola]
MRNLFKTLILSTGFAVLVCNGAPLPANTTTTVSHDPCAYLATLNSTQLTVDDVSNCYKSIEFNPSIAKTTLETFYTIYHDFYVFRDSALTPKLQLSFVSPPVDILAGLEEIYKKRYSSDYEFHMDVNYLINRLNDTQCTYAPTCYNSYFFQQEIGIYAPIENGVQTFRVLLDDTGRGTEGCQVLAIDGISTGAYLQAFADKYTGYSKDPGDLSPDANHVTYTIQCDAQGPGNGQPFDLQVDWVVGIVPGTPAFSDKESYVQNVCLVPAPNTTTSGGSTGPSINERYPVQNIEHDSIDRRLRRVAEKQSLVKRKAPTPSKDFPDAVFVAGNNTAVYQLKSKPTVGILVLPTMEVDMDTEVFAVQDYLEKLAKLGVTNIIIDTFNNGGGYVSFASYVVDTFFPSKNKRKTSHLSRFKVSHIATELTTTNLLNTSISSYYSPQAMFADPVTDKPIDMTINGVTADYTQKYYLNYDLSGIDQNVTYPWTDDASKITILSDGQCGSACGMITDFFTFYGVKIVSVGGSRQRELFMYSFPGASVLKYDILELTFELLGVTPNFAPLPYQNLVQFGVIEIYRENDAIPLEYNPSRYPAAYRIDYTNSTALHHDQLWGAVAQTTWSI